MPLLNSLRDGTVFANGRLENKVVTVLPGDRLVRGHGNHLEPIDREELFFRGESGTRHAGELLVHAKKILERNGGVRTRLGFDCHTLFGFDCLVQALAPAPPRLRATSKLVDDHDLVVPDNIFLILMEERFGAYCRLEVMRILDTAFGIQILYTKRLLGLRDAHFS